MNENHYAYYINMGIIGNVCLILFYNNKKLDVLYFLLYLINCHTLVLNNTLGCFLSFLFTLFLIFILLLFVKNNSLKICKFVFLMFLFIVICFINKNIVFNNFSGLFGDTALIVSNVTNKDDINEIYGVGTNRLGLWIVAIEFIKEKPIFGYGPANLLEQYIRVNKTEITAKPHNEYLQIGASVGIPGLIFYLLFLGFLCFRIKQFSIFEISILFIIITYLVSAFFGVSIFYTTSYLYFFLGLLNCNQTKTNITKL